VAHVARRYIPLVEKRNGIDFDDLIQSGYIGIIAAVWQYDPERGAKFSSFAVFYIRREIRRALGILSSKRDPIDTALPLDAPLNDDEADSATLGDTIAAKEQPDRLEDKELSEAVRAAVGRIRNDNDRSAIEAYYWDGKTEGQIAEDCGVTGGAIGDRLYRGYRSLRRDSTLLKWVVDYGYTNFYRHKGVRAFHNTFSSVVEDIIIQAEERDEKRAALADVLGSLL
jgi:RNA polymerase sporulation-specific sigma factor